MLALAFPALDTIDLLYFVVDIDRVAWLAFLALDVDRLAWLASQLVRIMLLIPRRRSHAEGRGELGRAPAEHRPGMGGPQGLGPVIGGLAHLLDTAWCLIHRPWPACCRHCSLSQLVVDIGQLVVDMGQLDVDIGQLVADSGELVADIGELVVDIGQLVVDIDQLVADSGELVAGIGELVADMGELVAEIGELVADIAVLAQSQGSTRQGLGRFRATCCHLPSSTGS